ncbi:hypothetical protein [Clostridium sp.]|uniref:hypothetical protein n=1 Tax=Clostridium sp. TaxID=1506 RepID=UPI002913BAAD|nr:hypothetical protein [Clostridium sp.]MDU4477663.1 hypothetical protein [Clostridium sp.]
MKFKIYVDETRTFRHEFIVEAESQEELDSVLDEIESERMLGINDYEFSLREKCNLVESAEDQDGDLGEIECTDMEEIEESEVEQ